MTITRRRVLAGFGYAAAVVAAGQAPLGAMDSTPHSHGPNEATPTHAGSGTSAVFMTITNHGDEVDTLTKAESDIAEFVEVHEMVMEGDTMKMQELSEGLEIPAGETVHLERGGYHIMLINLTRDLNEGEEFDLKLSFATNGDVSLTVTAANEALDESTEVGDLEIGGVFARPAPMLGGMDHGTPIATPSH